MTETSETERNQRLITGFKLVTKESNRLSGWALLIIGGSLVAVLQKDYFQLDGVYRYTYFLFILGWGLLCCSIYCGEKIARGYIASIMVTAKYIDDIGSSMNSTFRKQTYFLFSGVAVFSIWMILFLLLRILNFQNAIYHG